MPRSVLLAAVMAAALSACGGGGTGVDGGTGGGSTGAGGGFAGGGGGGGGGAVEDAGLSASNFCARYANVWCTRQTQCGPTRIVNINDCFNDQVRSCELSAGQPVRAGGAVLDLAAAEKCMSEVQKAACDMIPLTYDAYCTDLLDLDGQVGEGCSNLGYCKDGWCREDGGAGNCGVCASHLPLNATCTVGGGQCDPDAGTCVANALTGNTCQRWLEQGQSCTTSSRCRSGYCLNRGDGGVFCTPINTGESCGAHVYCGADSYCRGLSTVTNPTCRNRLALGAACQDEASDDGCLGEDATCLDGVCKVVPFGSRTEGQSCDNARQCGTGLFCSGYRASATRAGVCAKKLVADAGCQGNFYPNECEHGLFCLQQRCVPYAQPEERCISSAQCIPYSRCLSMGDGGNECVAFVPPGVKCPSANMCLGGYCDRLPDLTYGPCTPYKQDGDTCTTTAQCLSSQCFAPGASTQLVCVASCF